MNRLGMQTNSPLTLPTNKAAFSFKRMVNCHSNSYRRAREGLENTPKKAIGIEITENKVGKDLKTLLQNINFTLSAPSVYQLSLCHS